MAPAVDRASRTTGDAIAGGSLTAEVMPKRLRVVPRPPFPSDMEIKGSGMAGAVYDVAVAKKALQSTREQGQQALQLIQAATPTAPSASSGVGTRLDVVA